MEDSQTISRIDDGADALVKSIVIVNPGVNVEYVAEDLKELGFQVLKPLRGIWAVLLNLDAGGADVIKQFPCVIMVLQFHSEETLH